MLDRLRAARKLPEQADFRNWKSELHEAYRALEPREHEWHLPDGRTLRVVTTPNPEGGVTYLFDDVTERLKLVRRYEALIGVQGETLEALAEGVAVFGSDGRLDLHNPAFAQHVAAGRRDAQRRQASARTSRPCSAGAGRSMATTRSGRSCAAPSPALDEREPIRRGSNGSTAACSIAPPCRCPTARRW